MLIIVCTAIGIGVGTLVGSLVSKEKNIGEKDSRSITK